LRDLVNKLIDRLISIDDPSIDGLGIGGSRGAQDSADELADLDLFILVNSGHLESFLARLPILARRLGDPLLCRGPIFVPNYGYSLTIIFAPLLCCQFNVNDAVTLVPHHCRKHTRVLLDHSGHLTRVTMASRALGIDHKHVFEEATATFWHRVLDTSRDLRRKQYWMALRHQADARQQLLVFARLAANCDPRDYYLVEKAFEADLGISISEALRPAQPEYSPPSILLALQFVVHWVNENAPSLAVRLGAEYPFIVANRLTAEVTSIADATDERS
jgi:hypothetical protein